MLAFMAVPRALVEVCVVPFALAGVYVFRRASVGVSALLSSFLLDLMGFLLCLYVCMQPELASVTSRWDELDTAYIDRLAFICSLPGTPTFLMRRLMQARLCTDAVSSLQHSEYVSFELSSTWNLHTCRTRMEVSPCNVI